MTRSLRHPGRVLAMVLIAIALNLVPVTLPGGGRLLPGTFVALPLVLVLPAPWALLAAMMPAAVTIVTLGHPFLVIVATLEALWLRGGSRLGRHRWLLHDFLFWAIAGVPLVVLLYHGVARITPDIVAMIVVKQALNHLFAVAIAAFLVRNSRLAVWIAGGLAPRVRMREAVFQSVFLLAVVPVALVGVASAVLIRTYSEREDRATLTSSARHVARQLEVFLESHQAAVTTIARTLDRGGGDPAALLEETRRAHTEFTTLFVTDAAGRIVHAATAAPAAGEQNLRVDDRDYFRQARDLDRPFVSGVFRGRGFGRDVLVAISAPLHGPDGRFAGIVEASLEVQRFGSLVAGDNPMPDVGLLLADARGRVIYGDATTGIPSLASLRYYAQGRLLAAGADGSAFEFDHATAAGVMRRYVAYAARAESNGVVVIAERPLLTGLGGAAWMLVAAAALTVGIVAVAAGVTRAARLRVAVPLENFARGATRQAALRTVEPIAEQATGAPQEIVMVYRAFNNLAVKLSGTHALLRRQNRELDQRVAERTRDLEVARAQAVAASESKSSFLAMTSHEIRTPLNAIIGLAGALAETASDAAAALRLRTIRTSGVRLLNVVNDLLDLTQIEAGRLELKPTAVELGQLCEEVRALFDLAAQQQGLKLAVELPAGWPLWFETDGARLQQVLINLVGNAMKFTRTGGVRLRIAAPAASADEATLRFAVIDTGPGIAEEEQRKLFKPYVQLAQAAQISTRGTGLGLSISRRLVQLFGGELALRSEVGRGAEFYFALTLRRVQPLETTPAPARAVVFGRVLVVDDNLVNQEVARSMLEDRCARLEIADSAGTAMDWLEREKFDVALIDLEMPDADGYSVARAVRGWAGAEASRGCRLVACSAHRRAEVWERCATEGFDDYVAKPIERSELNRALAGSMTGACAA